MKTKKNEITIEGINNGEPIIVDSIRLGTQKDIQELKNSDDLMAGYYISWITLNDLLSDKYIPIKDVMAGKGVVTEDQINNVKDDKMFTISSMLLGITEERSEEHTSELQSH